ncbi:hypothetical protein MRX96_000626 [Rhipicephalus microplus]
MGPAKRTAHALSVGKKQRYPDQAFAEDHEGRCPEDRIRHRNCVSGAVSPVCSTPLCNFKTVRPLQLLAYSSVTPPPKKSKAPRNPE